MTREYCVYMHTAQNGKRYVGITCCKPRNRRWQNGYGYVENDYFFRAIKKYGWVNFKHEILEDNLTAEEAGRLEVKYIAKFKTTDKRFGYNILDGGQVGFHIPDEQKKKISAANSGSKNGMYGYKYTDEQRKEMSKNSVWRGKKHTPESIAKMSAATKKYFETHKARSGKDHPMYGKRHSEESKRKMSEAAKKRGCTMSREMIERNAQKHRKPVCQYTVNGDFIAWYPCASEGAKAVGLKRHSGICACANNNPRHKTAGGYVWRYADGNEPTV